MKNREEALKHLAMGIDQIIADRAERMAKKSAAPEEEEEYEDEEGAEAEGEEMGAEMGGEEPMPEAELSPEGGEEMPEGEEGEYSQADQDAEMEEMKRQLDEKIKGKPQAIRR